MSITTLNVFMLVICTFIANTVTVPVQSSEPDHHNESPAQHNTSAPHQQDNSTAQICVKFSEQNPDNVQDVIDWFTEFTRDGDGTYQPYQLQEKYGIPEKAFNCPGPYMTRGKPTTCVVTTKDYCFTPKGSTNDTKMAWAVLNLIARFRIAQSVVDEMYFTALIPPEKGGYGKGLARDFSQIIGDFYNGAYGDSALPAEDIIYILGTLFMYAPFNISSSSILFHANKNALTDAIQQKAAFNCQWYDLSNSSDCLTKPGFGIVLKTSLEQRQSFDGSFDYVQAVKEVLPMSISLKPDTGEMLKQYQSYRQYFQRAMFMQVQRAQSLFLHKQPYDIQPADMDDYDAHWDLFCDSIITDKAGAWCDDQADPDSRAYYPVQITGRNERLEYDYPAWDKTYGEYEWDPHRIMTESSRCADIRNQDWSLKGDTIYPQISSNILEHDTAMSFINREDIDSTDCLWNLPILEFSDGPNYQGFSKFWDTIVTIFGDAPEQPRMQWKDEGGRAYQVWNYIRATTDFCPDGLPSKYETHGDLSGFNGWANADNDDSGDSFVRNVLGWGMVSADDQIVADVFGAVQLVTAPDIAVNALQEIKSVACANQLRDAEADISKSMADLAINIGIAWVSGGSGSAILDLVSMSWHAAVAQSVADAEWLQPALDSVLANQFTYDTPEGKQAREALAPYIDTAKNGDGVA